MTEQVLTSDLIRHCKFIFETCHESEVYLPDRRVFFPKHLIEYKLSRFRECRLLHFCRATVEMCDWG